MTRDELIPWAAGFFDGEGSISLSKHRINKGRYISFLLHMKASQNSLEPLLTLKSLFGGSIYRKRRNPEKNWADSWEWVLTGKAVSRVCSELLPYLQVKNGQASLAIQYTEIASHHGRHNRSQPRTHAELEECTEMVRLFRALNAKGRFSRPIHPPTEKPKQVPQLRLLA